MNTENTVRTYSDLALFSGGNAPVVGKAAQYPVGHSTPMHQHTSAQLVHASSGVMAVSTPVGHWVVPPTRGIWVPAATPHAVRMVSAVHMRTVFVRPETRPELPTTCCVVAISPLLRELLIAATAIQQPYEADSRNARIMQLLLDELTTLPTLPLHLPLPTDPRLRRLCQALLSQPDNNATLQEWGNVVGADARTIQRLFVRETQLRFGQWRQQARLLLGLEQLAAGTRVIDVALNLGYQSPSAFTAMFKRQFGAVPSTFFDNEIG